MKTVYYKLPNYTDTLSRYWDERPHHVPGKTYNVSKNGVVIGRPKKMIATVIGSQTFGVRGNDVDFGVISRQAKKLPDNVETHETIYPNYGRVISEYREVKHGDETHSFMALPRWRAEHDAYEYERAAKTMNLAQWQEDKKRDKVEAYRKIGITTQNPDGTYNAKFKHRKRL